jgi:hypothetical protein
MTATHSESSKEERERLEEQADVLRERLISDIDDLTDRKRRVSALVETLTEGAKRYKTPLIAGGAAIAVLSLVVFVKQRASARRQERRRAWGHVAMQLLGVSPPPPKEPGFLHKSLTGLAPLARSLTWLVADGHVARAWSAAEGPGQPKR